jgi:phosphomannomutase
MPPASAAAAAAKARPLPRVASVAGAAAAVAQLHCVDGAPGHPIAIAGFSVLTYEDLLVPTDGLPPTNALRLFLDGGIRIIIRPSGTEAKLKCYIEVVRPTGSQSDKTIAEEAINSLRTELLAILA